MASALRRLCPVWRYLHGTGDPLFAHADLQDCRLDLRPATRGGSWNRPHALLAKGAGSLAPVGRGRCCVVWLLLCPGHLSSMGTGRFNLACAWARHGDPRGSSELRQPACARQIIRNPACASGFDDARSLQHRSPSNVSLVHGWRRRVQPAGMELRHRPPDIGRLDILALPHLRRGAITCSRSRMAEVHHAGALPPRPWRLVVEARA